MTEPDHYLYGGKPAEVTSASGVKGILISSFDGEYSFRVYTGDGEFIDYDLRHDDLSITINADAFAAFYRVDGHDVLDHDPQVLGLKKAPPGGIADR
jgi:hypothetical protein